MRPLSVYEIVVHGGSNSSSFGWTTAVVRDWCNIPDNGHFKTRILDCPDCGISSYAWPLNPNLYPTQAHTHGILCRSFSSQLTSKWRRFSAAPYPDFSGRSPRNDIALNVGQCNHGIVKAREDMGNTKSLYLLRLFSLFSTAFWWQTWPSSLDGAYCCNDPAPTTLQVLSFFRRSRALGPS